MPNSRLNGRPTSSPESPGIQGAIKDAVNAVAQAASPGVLKQKYQAARVQAGEDNDDADLGRMKQAQSTDRDNSYSY